MANIKKYRPHSIIDAEPEATDPNQPIVFWDGEGNILPSKLFRYLGSVGIGSYYPKKADQKVDNPLIVKLEGRLVSEVTEGYLARITHEYIIQKTEESGFCDVILDSFHNRLSLFGGRNQKLLPVLNLDFIEDSRESAFLFFLNGVVKIKGDSIRLIPYDEITGNVWQNNIINQEFVQMSYDEIKGRCDFLNFLRDLTIVEEEEESEARFCSLLSIIGYLCHRYKDSTLTKAIVLMDAVSNGNANGRTGKTLLCNAVGKVRKLSPLDGKSYDQRRWYRYSGVGFDTDILLFDDIPKKFDMEHLFPLMTTGLSVSRRSKDDVFIPFEESPKVVITTNFAVNGEGSSYRGRMFEFELSNTFNAEYQPTDRYGRRFFDEWSEHDWNMFFNLLMFALRHYLRHGLVQSKPINLKLTKLIHKTNEDFIDFAKERIKMNIQYDKRELLTRFTNDFPDNKLTSRTFTDWLRAWGNYIGVHVDESHSNLVRNIRFIKRSDS